MACTLLGTSVGNGVSAAHEKSKTHALLRSVYASSLRRFSAKLESGSGVGFDGCDEETTRR